MFASKNVRLIYLFRNSCILPVLYTNRILSISSKMFPIKKKTDTRHRTKTQLSSEIFSDMVYINEMLRENCVPLKNKDVTDPKEIISK